MSTPVSERTTVCVCICTFRRPDELRRLLEQLVVVADDARSVARVGVVVVDDDPGGSAAVVADDMAPAFDLGLRYVRSGTGNISVARNHALRHGGEVGAWLALIDDDCLPDDDWLRQLLEIQRRTGADCVTGACIDEPPPGAPAWLVEDPFLSGLTEGVDGEAVDIGMLKNTMVSAAFLRQHELGFDEAFGRAGGEDVMFFHGVHLTGARHHHAAKALVREKVPAERATFRYRLSRSWWYGNTESITSIAAGRAGRLRMAASGAKKVVAAALAPLSELVRRRRARWRFATCEVVRGLGRVVGAAGIKVHHR